MILFRQLAAISASSVPKSTPILEKSVVPPTAVKLIVLHKPCFINFNCIAAMNSLKQNKPPQL
jgi:hypothetical protein